MSCISYKSIKNKLFSILVIFREIKKEKKKKKTKVIISILRMSSDKRKTFQIKA
jgi:hypothetical protein